jgi:hypothetical protein
MLIVITLYTYWRLCTSFFIAIVIPWSMYLYYYLFRFSLRAWALLPSSVIVGNNPVIHTDRYLTTHIISDDLTARAKRNSVIFTFDAKIPSGGLTLTLGTQKWGFSCKVQRRPPADICLNKNLPPKTPLRTPCSWPPWPWFSCEKSLKIFKVS